jgi:hypothetical protein
LTEGWLRVKIALNVPEKLKPQFHKPSCPDKERPVRFGLQIIEKIIDLAA